MAMREQSASASSIICVVMITARSGVANELTRPQISLRVDGSSPVVGLQIEEGRKDKVMEDVVREYSELNI